MKSLLLVQLTGILLFSASSGEKLTAPVLGYVFDPGVSGLRPIRGIPGSATLGPALELAPLARAEAAPGRNYALAVTASDGEVLLVRTAPELAAAPLAGVAPGPERIAISPSGAAAALYYPEANLVQVVTGLPDEPAVARAIELSGIPAALAVNDAGDVLVALDDAVQLVPVEGEPRFVMAAGRVQAVSFAPGGRDALVAGEKLYLVRDLAGAAAQIPIAGQAEGVIAVQAAADGRRVFAATAAGAVMVFDLSDGSVAVFECQCAPTGLVRLNGDAVFRLNAPSSGPIWLFDADAVEPALLFVPPDPPVAAEVGEEVGR